MAHHGDKAHEALTEQELRDLDAADGVIDGKFHGANLSNMTHDATKSTREGEWEFRDGKYWRRDYYGASIPKKETPPPPPPPVHVCDHTECRRQLAQKETLIAELHRLLADRDDTILQLKSRVSSLLIQIERYETRITTLENELRILRTAPAPQPAPIIVQEAPQNSYYVVRSGRGAELLKMYGKTDIVVGQPYGYGDYGQYNVASGFTPVVPSMQQQMQQIVVAQTHVQPMSTVTVSQPQRTMVEVRETQHVRSGENQYYNVDSEAMRARLDAMDGVIDGQLNGVDIRIGAGHGHSTTTTTRHVHGHTEGREFYRVDDEATRNRLDAMDGVIDGKFDGREIQLKGGAHGHSHHGHSSHSHVSGREYYRADDDGAAARLDAMDGVIDGRLHGTDIVTRGRNGDKIKRKK